LPAVEAFQPFPGFSPREKDRAAIAASKNKKFIVQH